MAYDLFKEIADHCASKITHSLPRKLFLFATAHLWIAAHAMQSSVEKERTKCLEALRDTLHMDQGLVEKVSSYVQGHWANGKQGESLACVFVHVAHVFQSLDALCALWIRKKIPCTEACAHMLLHHVQDVSGHVSGDVWIKWATVADVSAQGLLMAHALRLSPNWRLVRSWLQSSMIFASRGCIKEAWTCLQYAARTRRDLSWTSDADAVIPLLHRIQSATKVYTFTASKSKRQIAWSLWYKGLMDCTDASVAGCMQRACAEWCTDAVSAWKAWKATRWSDHAAHAKATYAMARKAAQKDARYWSSVLAALQAWSHQAQETEQVTAWMLGDRFEEVAMIPDLSLESMTWATAFTVDVQSALGRLVSSDVALDRVSALRPRFMPCLHNDAETLHRATLHHARSDPVASLDAGRSLLRCHQATIEDRLATIRLCATQRQWELGLSMCNVSDASSIDVAMLTCWKAILLRAKGTPDRTTVQAALASAQQHADPALATLVSSVVQDALVMRQHAQDVHQAVSTLTLPVETMVHYWRDMYAYDHADTYHPVQEASPLGHMQDWLNELNTTWHTVEHQYDAQSSLADLDQRLYWVHKLGIAYWMAGNARECVRHWLHGYQLAQRIHSVIYQVRCGMGLWLTYRRSETSEADDMETALVDLLHTMDHGSVDVYIAWNALHTHCKTHAEDLHAAKCAMESNPWLTDNDRSTALSRLHAIWGDALTLPNPSLDMHRLPHGAHPHMVAAQCRQHARSAPIAQGIFYAHWGLGIGWREQLRHKLKGSETQRVIETCHDHGADAFQEVLSALDPSWTVLSLQEDQEGLIIYAWHAHEVHRVFCTVPNWTEIKSSFASLLVENTETTTATHAVGMTSRQKRAWWTRRNRLDQSMADMVTMLETHVCSALKGHVHSSVLLVMEASLECFPWESTASLVGKNVTRMPSVFLAHAHNTDAFPRHAPSDRAFIVNPSGDLEATEARVVPFLTKEVGAVNAWNAKDPAGSFSNALTEHALFVYCGHAAGERFLHGYQVQELTHCATSLLMGCSSGRLRLHGTMEATGMIYAYLLAGAPLVIGNLWDVTDRDIDTFSMDVLTNMYKEDGLSKAVQSARSVCKLSMLNGAAPVSWGLPGKQHGEA